MDHSFSELKRLAKRLLGLEVYTWSPGDGVRRYRFAQPGLCYDLAYNHPKGFHTVCGLTRAWEALEAMTFAHRHLREFRREDQV